MKVWRPKYRERDPKTGRKTGPWRESSIYRVRFYIDGIRYEKSTGKTLKSAAEMEARDWFEACQLAAAGVQTHHDTRTVKLGGLVEEYLGELRRRGRSPKHLQALAPRLEAMVEGVNRLADLTPQYIRRRLSVLSQPAERGATKVRKALSHRTTNRYRQALFGFFRWLVSEDRWPRNPVEAVPTLSEVEPDRQRRAMTPEGLDRLVAAVPLYRAACYELAASTGLRRGEVKQLRRSDLDLDARTVRARAKTTKAKKGAVIPLTERAVAVLRRHLAALPTNAGDAVFPRVPSIATFYRDLGKAGIEQDTPEGVLDFHALRVTFVTDLARAGVGLVDAQRLARHSVPRLTSNVYSKVNLDDARKAVGKLEAHRLPSRLPSRSGVSQTDSQALTALPATKESEAEGEDDGEGEPAAKPHGAGDCGRCAGAEGEGFEPPVLLPGHRFSKPAPAPHATSDGATALRREPPPALSPALPVTTPAPADLAAALLEQARTMPDPRAMYDAAAALLAKAAAPPAPIPLRVVDRREA